MHWLIYALGGGLGHLTRSLALARAARKNNVRVTLLTNSPYAGTLPVNQELDSEDRVVVIPSELSREATAATVRRSLAETQADLIAVDTFPRGLGGELVELLPRLAMPKVLVHRDLNPGYVHSYQLDAFVAEVYDLVLTPGESGSLKVPVTATEPWLIRDASELLSVEEARTAFSIADHDKRPCCLIPGCGRPEEALEMRQLAEWLRDRLSNRVCIRFCSPDANATHIIWPLLPVLPGVDVIIGAGGYNTVHEARATGTPLLALPRPRLYDRQAQRLAPGETFETRHQLLERLVVLTEENNRSRLKPMPQYVNGTHHAFRSLLSLFG